MTSAAFPVEGLEQERGAGGERLLRMVGPTDVTNPNVVESPERERGENWTVMFGMFQSDSTRSGFHPHCGEALGRSLLRDLLISTPLGACGSRSSASPCCRPRPASLPPWLGCSLLALRTVRLHPTSWTGRADVTVRTGPTTPGGQDRRDQKDVFGAYVPQRQACPSSHRFARPLNLILRDISPKPKFLTPMTI
jgi:hypothetical protein